MCDIAGVILAYLPPYSPDYNPIETSFTVLKRWLKANGHLVEYYGDRPADFERFLQDAIRAQGNRHDPGALFRKAGIYYDYVVCCGYF
jgi:transposase